MTIREARRIFREEYADFIKEHRDDYIMLNEAYFIYLDSLCKDGQITDKQYSNAVSPYGRNKR